MQLLDFVALALAVSACVSAWLQEGGLFSEVLGWLEAWGSIGPQDLSEGGRPKLRAFLRYKVSYGLQCARCLSYHAAFWLLILFYVPSKLLPSPWSWICILPIYSLAATQLSLIFREEA